MKMARASNVGQANAGLAVIFFLGCTMLSAEAFTPLRFSPATSLSPSQASFIGPRSIEIPTQSLNSFQPRRYLPAKTNNRLNNRLHMLPTTEIGDLLSSSSSTILSTVPVFDGSSIVDPVVVSNAFWGGIQRQMVSLVIGQFLAVTVFGVFTTVASTQISKLGTYVAENVFKQQPSNTKGLKQPPPGYTGGVRVEPDIGKLLICIIIDIIGTSSELIPLVGELTDLAWAPIAALFLRNLFYGSNVVFALEFAEEFFPYTDILPLASICWVVDTFFPDSDIAKVLQLGTYSAKPQDFTTKDGATDSRYDRWKTADRRKDGAVIDVEVESLPNRQLPPEKKL